MASKLLDAAVREKFALSWNRARELVTRGKIKVDGRVVTSGTTRIREGATIEMELAAPNPRIAKSALPKNALVFVDGHVVVVEKPAGISTVPFDPEGMGASIARRAALHEEATLDQRVRIALGKLTNHAGPPPEIGIVHRLDKDTTGLIVFTRSWAAKKALTAAFRAHQVHRRYLALVHGHPKSQTIESRFVEDRGDGLRGSVEKRRGRKHAVGGEHTQRAITHFDVLETFTAGGQPTALVACRLETGRTHQIRIHLAEAGHPLLGEKVYIRDWRGPLVQAPRVMLHAAELGFEHPQTMEQMQWESPLPSDMGEMQKYLNP